MATATATNIYFEQEEQKQEEQKQQRSGVAACCEAQPSERFVTVRSDDHIFCCVLHLDFIGPDDDLHVCRSAACCRIALLRRRSRRFFLTCSGHTTTDNNVGLVAETVSSSPFWKTLSNQAKRKELVSLRHYHPRTSPASSVPPVLVAVLVLP